MEGRPVGSIVNLADRRARAAREAQLALVADGPDRVIAALREAERAIDPVPTTPPLPHLKLPAHHDVRSEDVVMRRLRGALAAAAERGPEDFADLLLTPGLGARTVATLALVAEVIHAAPSRFSDPARYSFALGGKDGHPFPVPLDVYDETLRVLRDAVSRAKLGQDDRSDALRRLDRESRRLERRVEGGPDFEEIVERERRSAPAFGGRTVGSRPRRGPAPKGGPQLALPGLVPRR